jgi:hypothetical protein
VKGEGHFSATADVELIINIGHNPEGKEEEGKGERRRERGGGERVGGERVGGSGEKG